MAVPRGTHPHPTLTATEAPTMPSRTTNPPPPPAPPLPPPPSSKATHAPSPGCARTARCWPLRSGGCGPPAQAQAQALQPRCLGRCATPCSTAPPRCSCGHWGFAGRVLFCVRVCGCSHLLATVVPRASATLQWIIALVALHTTNPPPHASTTHLPSSTSWAPCLRAWAAEGAAPAPAPAPQPSRTTRARAFRKLGRGGGGAGGGWWC